MLFHKDVKAYSEFHAAKQNEYKVNKQFTTSSHQLQKKLAPTNYRTSTTSAAAPAMRLMARQLWPVATGAAENTKNPEPVEQARKQIYITM